MSLPTEISLQKTPGWDDYELIDSGNGRRLERFGKYVLSRPDPQCLWMPKKDVSIWQKADGVFEEGAGRRMANGEWQIDKHTSNWKKIIAIPERWEMRWGEISFFAKLSPFKHTGVFPEQVAQWETLKNIIEGSRLRSNNKSLKLLNLFAYTGIASLVAAKAGAEVTHVDASSSAINWGKENQRLSGLDDKPIRWILDDVMKFVSREIRRGNTYDIILMDPPIYGHGPEREVWDFDKHFSTLVQQCSLLLSKSPILFLVNAYAISASSLMLGNVLESFLPAGEITSGELALQEKESGRLLSTGIYSQWAPSM